MRILPVRNHNAADLFLLFDLEPFAGPAVQRVNIFINALQSSSMVCNHFVLCVLAGPPAPQRVEVLINPLRSSSMVCNCFAHAINRMELT